MAKKSSKTEAPSSTDPVYIHGVKVENFMGIKLVEIKISPQGDLIQITGENEQGKSSLLKAIRAAMGGRRAIGDKPVRKGAEEALSEVDLGDKIVTLEIPTEGEPKLTVRTKDGAKYGSPQRLLDSLKGEFTFDPLAFAKLSAEEQAASLLTFVGVNLGELDEKYGSLYYDRTFSNRELTRLKAIYDSRKPLPENLPALEEPKDLQELYKKKADLVDANFRNVQLREQLEKAKETVKQCDTDLAASQSTLEASLGQLEQDKSTDKSDGILASFDDIGKSIDALVERCGKAQGFLLSRNIPKRMPVSQLKMARDDVSEVREFYLSMIYKRQSESEKKIENIQLSRKVLSEKQSKAQAFIVDLAAKWTDPGVLSVTSIDEEIANVSAHNALIATSRKALDEYSALKADYDRQAKFIEEKAAQSAKLTEQLQAIDAEKAKLLAEAKFPVDGLSVVTEFDESGRAKRKYVTFQGLPLENESTSKQLRICMDIAASFNPNLMVLLIEEGNDLDKTRLRMVGEWAREKGYQTFLERVAGDVPVGIVIDHGEVVGDYR